MNTVDRRLERALACASSGDHARAEKLLAAILVEDAANFDALQILGGIKMELGDVRSAMELLRRAITTDGDFPPARMNYGVCLARSGEHEAALRQFDEALRRRPAYAEAFFNKGQSLKALGRLEEAVVAFARSCALDATRAKPLAALCETLMEAGRPAEAEAHVARGLAAHPDSVDVLLAAARLTLATGTPQDAVAQLRSALRQHSRNPDVHNRLGEALAAMGELRAAIQSYRAASKLSPNDGDAHARVSALLLRLGEPHEADAEAAAAYAAFMRASQLWCERGNFGAALKEIDKALAMRPADALAHLRRAAVLLDLKRREEALRSYQDALMADASLPYLEGEICHLRQRLADWSGLGARKRNLAARVADGRMCVTPSSLLALVDDPRLSLTAARTMIADQFGAVEPKRLAPSGQGRVIRIGYVSADFYHHATMHLMSGVFARHDRRRFHVSAFSGVKVKDDVHHRVQASFDAFHDIAHLNDDEAARMIRRSGVDIAIDLNGFTKDGRLGVFARGVAPVQVSYLGYAGTTGADFMDYVIADRVVIPPQDRIHYAEKVACLPFAYQPNDGGRRPAPDVGARADHGLPDGAFVYCCFNDAYKITPERFDLWMRILRETEDSVLWLIASDPGADRNFRTEAQARGVAPERLVFGPRLPVEKHLARHSFADLFLDTAPYNAHTTAADAIWMGVPVLTLPGRSFQSRVAASLLHACGAPEMVVPSDEDYVRSAVDAARNPQTLLAMRARMAQARTSPLFDIDRFTRDLERLYETMWARARAGAPPDHIDIAG